MPSSAVDEARDRVTSRPAAKQIIDPALHTLPGSCLRSYVSMNHTHFGRTSAQIM